MGSNCCYKYSLNTAKLARLPAKVVIVVVVVNLNRKEFIFRENTFLHLLTGHEL